jgi:pheromone shutdown protein TraB
MDKLEQFIEYAKLHLISVEQDAEKLQTLMNEFEGDFDSDEYRKLELADIINTGEMTATNHLLSVATDILEGKPVGRE